MNEEDKRRIVRDGKGRRRIERGDPKPTSKVKGAAQGGTLGSAAAALVTAIVTGGDVDAAAAVFGACLGTTGAAFVVAYVRRSFAGE